MSQTLQECLKTIGRLHKPAFGDVMDIGDIIRVHAAGSRADRRQLFVDEYLKMVRATAQIMTFEAESVSGRLKPHHMHSATSLFGRIQLRLWTLDELVTGDRELADDFYNGKITIAAHEKEFSFKRLRLSGQSFRLAALHLVKVICDSIADLQSQIRYRLRYGAG